MGIGLRLLAGADVVASVTAKLEASTLKDQISHEVRQGPNEPSNRLGTRTTQVSVDKVTSSVVAVSEEPLWRLIRILPIA